MNRVRNLKTVLWAVTGLAFAVGVTRFVFGLGVTTHLSDSVPWGFWIGFDVMSGVALAGGGFVLTAFFYIFGREEYHPLVRPAVLTAFLGYLAVIAGLLFDLGLPWNIWHMIVWWNPHSPLFEVGWCVMLYTTVLALEFMPVPLEGQRRWKRIHDVLTRFRIPLVILGISLSTLHQSSLGTLFTIMPYRLHPLWYSPILPLLFFLSAIALGLFMVTFESETTAWIYKRKPETSILAKLNRATPWVVLTYLALRFADIFVRGKGHYLIDGSFPSIMFWIETGVFMLLPVGLLLVRKTRMNTNTLWTAAWLGVFGVVLNRVNTGGLMHMGRGMTVYVPSWTEITISVGVVSAAALVFFFVIEHFHILESRPRDPETGPGEKAHWDPVGMIWLGAPDVAARVRYSLVFILAAGVGMMLLNGSTVHGEGVTWTPARAARGGDTLWVDGNHDGYGVAFTHARHMKRSEKMDGRCAVCHHMNLPGDRNTACSACHRDEYLTTDAFGHDWHSSPGGANLACVQCHARGAVRSAATAKRCDQCHADLIPDGATVQIKGYEAVSYTSALHETCIGCHKQEAIRLKKEGMPRCAHCHSEIRDFTKTEGAVFALTPEPGVVLPPLKTEMEK